MGNESASADGPESLIGSVEKLANVKVSHYSEVNQAGLARLEEELSPLGVDTANASTKQLVSAICHKFFGASSESISSMGELYTTCMSTDLSSSDATALFRALQGTEVSKTYQADAPSSKETDNGSTYSILDSDSWKSIIARVSNGMSPVATKRELAKYTSMRSGATVAIWNGVGVSVGMLAIRAMRGSSSTRRR